MKLVSEKALEWPPEAARAKVTQVIRGEDNFGLAAAWQDPV